MAPNSENTIRKRLTQEVSLFVGLLFAGIVLLPVAIWLIGNALFGEYAGHGFDDFFGTVMHKIRAGDRAAWFLVLSPYVGITTLRLMAWAWRHTAARAG